MNSLSVPQHLYHENKDNLGNITSVKFNGDYNDYFEKNRMASRLWLKKEWRLKKDVRKHIVKNYRYDVNADKNSKKKDLLREEKYEACKIEYLVENIPKDGVSPIEAHNNTFRYLDSKGKFKYYLKGPIIGTVFGLIMPIGGWNPIGFLASWSISTGIISGFNAAKGYKKKYDCLLIEDYSHSIDDIKI